MGINMWWTGSRRERQAPLEQSGPELRKRLLN